MQFSNYQQISFYCNSCKIIKRKTKTKEKKIKSSLGQYFTEFVIEKDLLREMKNINFSIIFYESCLLLPRGILCEKNLDVKQQLKTKRNKPKNIMNEIFCKKQI